MSRHSGSTASGRHYSGESYGRYSSGSDSRRSYDDHGSSRDGYHRAESNGNHGSRGRDQYHDSPRERNRGSRNDRSGNDGRSRSGHRAGRSGGSDGGTESGRHSSEASSSLRCEGCNDPIIGKMLRGSYSQAGQNHGKPLFRKNEETEGAPTGVLIYFWDDRDGPAQSGWWFGPKIGGDQVWAYSDDRRAPAPPSSGWHVPFNGPVDETLRLHGSPSGGEPSPKHARREHYDSASPRRQASRAAQRRLDDDSERRLDDGRGKDRKAPSAREQAADAVQRRLDEAERRESMLREQAAAAVRASIKTLSLATGSDLEVALGHLQKTLAEQRGALGGGPYADRVEIEVREALWHAQKRLEEIAVAETREIVGRLSHSTPEAFVDLRKELNEAQERNKTRLAVQKDAINQEVRQALERAEQHAIHVFAQPLTKAIDALPFATPESIDSLRAELTEAQAMALPQLARIGDSIHDRYNSEATRALEQAQSYVDQVVARRDEEERKRREEEAREKADVENVRDLVDKATTPARDAEEEVEVAIAEATAATQMCSVTKIEDLNAEEATKATQSAEELHTIASATFESAFATVRDLLSTLQGELRSLQRESKGATARSEACAELQQLRTSLSAKGHALSEVIGPLRAAREKASRKAAAVKKEKEQQDLFNKYDADGDGHLNQAEIVALAKGEFEIDASEEFLSKALGTICKEDEPGICYEKFQRLRQMLAIERSEIRARAKKAAEEEKKRLEEEEAERKRVEIAQRKDRAQTLVDDAGDLLAEAQEGLPKAEKGVQPLLAAEGEKLGSKDLRGAASATESALEPACVALKSARSKLTEAEQVLAADLRHLLKPEILRLTASLRREEERAERLRGIAVAARDRAAKKVKEEEKNQKQKKQLAKLQSQYDDYEEGDSE